MPRFRPLEVGMAGGTVYYEKPLTGRVALPQRYVAETLPIPNDATLAIFGLDRQTLCKGFDARFPL